MVFNIADLFDQWEAVGLFDFVLPFLLIFAVVFGVLTTTNILGGHKGANLIIALVIGILSLRLGFVQAFFTELFPRFSVGLAILLVIVIGAALFIPEQHRKGWAIGFAIGGAIIGLAAVIATFNTPQFDWFDSYFWQEYWGMIIGGILLVIVIVAIFVTSAPKSGGSDIGVKFSKWRDNLSS
jgi:peptidoglycan/LPS O-acetylase OafA/YrhL